MVKLTTKYLFRKISKKHQLQARRKNETDLDYLKRVTHLHLQSQFIDKIAPITECESVAVIYLQNNFLQRIQNMENFPRLTHLYLQHNYIGKMENLKSLTSLKKLYLGWNEITVVEGLEGLKNLTELHLENQRLPQGETIYFDPASVFHLGKSLQVLTISNNNVTSVASLKGLTSLRKLSIEGNQIKDLEDVVECLSCLPALEELSSRGNPVDSERKYLDAIVVAAKSLKAVNGKPINSQTRLFITNLANNRENRRKNLESSPGGSESKEGFSFGWGDDRTSCLTPRRIGSKLFPVLKEISQKNNQRVTKIDSQTNSTSDPVFRKSLKVSRLFTSSSYYY